MGPSAGLIACWWILGLSGVTIAGPLTSPRRDGSIADQDVNLRDGDDDDNHGLSEPSDAKLFLLESMASRLEDALHFGVPSSDNHGLSLAAAADDLKGNDYDVTMARALLLGRPAPSSTVMTSNPAFNSAALNDPDLWRSRRLDLDSDLDPALTPVASKRSYNSYRGYHYKRACDYSRLTADHIMAYLRTGRLCGRRVSHVRFALSGRK